MSIIQVSFERGRGVKHRSLQSIDLISKFIDTRLDNIRGSIRPQRPIPESYIYTRPKEITSKVGTTGQKITCEANYFRLTKKPEWNIHLYHIDFSPDVPDIKFRRYLVGTQREMLGGYLFDGTQIFLVRTLDGDPVVRSARGTTDETVYTMTFTLAKIVSMNENQSMQVLNLILRRAMDGLHLETVGRNKYDPAGAVRIYFLYNCFFICRVQNFAII